MSLATLDLDLEVFQGPFDLLLTLVLREEVDLLEVDLAEVVLAYVEHLERAGELDLEATTEFLVLIAALLELKSRLMLPREDEEGLDLEPRRGRRGAAGADARVPPLPRRGRASCASGSTAEHGFRYRSAPLPPQLRRVSVEAAEAAYDPERAGRGHRRPAAHAAAARPAPRAPPARSRSSSGCATCASLLARRGRFSFDDAVRGRRPPDRGGDAVRAARALQGGRGAGSRRCRSARSR